MPKIVDPALQRSEIRRAARRVFARRGVAGTGLAQVAAAAGMGRSSLYHYYPDKPSLVRDLVADLLAEEEALFAAAERGTGSPLDRLEELAASLPALFAEWSTVGRLLVELRSRDARRFRSFFRRIRHALASLITQGQRLGEIDASLDAALAAATVIGAIDGLLLQHFLDPRAFSDLDGLGAELVRILRKMLEP